MSEALVETLGRTTRWLARLGGAAVMAAAGLVTFEVIARKLFGFSLAGADEIAGYVLAVSFTLSLAFVVYERAHIRIELLVNHFPKSARFLLDLVAMLALLVFVGVIAFYAWGLLADSLTHGSRAVTPLQTPLAIPQALWFGGLCFSLFTGAVLLLIAVRAFLREGFGHAQRLIGIRTLDEEIEAEKLDVAQQRQEA